MASTISELLLAIYGDVLVAENIEKQVHWNGQLVCPHLWRLLLLALRSYLCGTQEKSHRTIISSRASSQNYSPSLEALAAIAPLMRATKLLMLTAAELDFLETNCAVLGQIWRYEIDKTHGGVHTPKVHLIERHFAEQARSEVRHSRCVWRRGQRSRARWRLCCANQ